MFTFSRLNVAVFLWSVCVGAVQNVGNTMHVLIESAEAGWWDN